MKSIADRLLEKNPLILDGAMGTELYRRGVQTRLPCWSSHALLHRPEIVREIHEDYINAGAEIITTNTFRTSFRSLTKEGYGDMAKDLTQLAVKLATEARENADSPNVWIAGSVAPLEDCYRPELKPDMKTAASEHAQMIEWLANAGVDLLLIETMNSIEEAVAAAQSAAVTGLPFFVSWVCGNEGKILSGENLEDAAAALKPYHVSAFLVNCMPTPHVNSAVVELKKFAANIPIGAYGNIGRPEPEFGWELTNEVDASTYSKYAAEWIGSGAKITGGCCGTNPEHIRKLKEQLAKHRY